VGPTNRLKMVVQSKNHRPKVVGVREKTPNKTRKRKFVPVREIQARKVGDPGKKNDTRETDVFKK